MQGLLINSALDAVRRYGRRAMEYTLRRGPAILPTLAGSFVPTIPSAPFDPADLGLATDLFTSAELEDLARSTLSRAQPTRTQHPTLPKHSISAATALMSSTLSASSIFRGNSTTSVLKPYPPKVLYHCPGAGAPGALAERRVRPGDVLWAEKVFE